MDEKSYKKLLIFNILYKTEKQLHIQFDKIDEYVKNYNGIRCLLLLEYNKIYDEIKYVISEKKNYWKILTFHVIILIKSVVKEEKVCIKINLIQNIFK